MDRPGASEPGRGFGDRVMDAQRSFRVILAAMAEPGVVHMLYADIEPPACLKPAATVVLLTLADHETPVWLQPHLTEAAAYVRFHTGASQAERAKQARFAVVDAAAVPSFSVFEQGEDRYPDRSATVIVECAGLTGGTPVELEGPGIRGRRSIAPLGLGQGFWADVTANTSRYPLGIDLILTSGREIMGLPRSTRAVASQAASRDARN